MGWEAIFPTRDEMAQMQFLKLIISEANFRLQGTSATTRCDCAAGLLRLQGNLASIMRAGAAGLMESTT